MTIYIDDEYKCHVQNNGNMTPIDTIMFDQKCPDFIEGYLFVPEGHAWTREDGEVFYGEMIMPWKPFEELDAAQRAYERAQLADMQAALELLGVNANG